MTEPPVPDLPRVECPTCGRLTPVGAFCGACGSPLLPPTGRRSVAAVRRGKDAPTHRRHAYAAHPNEHVLRPDVVSTLFPHLPHLRTAPFRIALAAVTVLLVVVGLFRLSGPGVLLAGCAVPFLYLVYLYEVRVYEHAPVAAVGLTFGLGLVLGYFFAHLTGRRITGAVLTESLRGVQGRDVLVKGVLLPLAAQALMLVGVLVLRRTKWFDESLDGFAFGAGGALGFVLASTLVNLWPELKQGVTADGDLTYTVVQILQRGLLLPVAYATGTGLIGAALWTRRQPGPRRGFHASLPVAVLVVVAVDIGLGIRAIVERRPVVTVLITLGVVIVLLLWARLSLHTMLLVEAGGPEQDAADEFGNGPPLVPVGPPTVCSHCHRRVPRMAFCPHCGVALRATPKVGAGRGRSVTP